jgi:hypothetical protein
MEEKKCGHLKAYVATLVEVNKPQRLSFTNRLTHAIQTKNIYINKISN